MNGDRRSACVALLLLSIARVASSAAPAGRAEPLARQEASRMSMGCAYAIVAYGHDQAAVARAMETALDEVDRIDRLMSDYKPESALSRLNREGGRGPVAVDPELFGIIAESLRYSRESAGAFDITVGPLMKAWGFFRGEGRVPDARELAAVRERVGYGHVILDAAAGTARFDRPGVELDLGGIAKGYAVDRAVAVLRKAGIAAALVSAGGSTAYALGAPPGQAAWPVEVQDPIDAARVAFTVPLRDRALSVSGRSEKSFEKDGVRYTHILDPRSGRPVPTILGAVVLAPTGMAGDAIDDVLFVMGTAAGRRYLSRVAATEAFLFLPQGTGWSMVRLRGRGTRAAHRGAGRSTTP